MKKRITALALSAAMIISSTSAFAASSFSDLNEFHAWAEPQIEEMTTLGIIKGYTDGTFRPDKAITKTEALVLISRVAGFVTADYSTFTNAAYEAYKDIITPYGTPYPNEVAYLMYKGILTKEELPAFISNDRASSPLLRYEMAELLVKLMRAEDSLAAHEDISLIYSDSGEIPISAESYVDFVTKASLMNGVYNPEFPNNIYFEPYSSVTRAQVAVLLHRVLDKAPTSASYVTLVGKNNIAKTITYTTGEGAPTIFKIEDNVNILIDGILTDNLDHASAGASVAFFYINNVLSDVEIVNTEQNRWDGTETVAETVQVDPVEGTITGIVLGSSNSVIIDSVQYEISPSAQIYVNDAASTVYDLRVGYSATAEFTEGKVTHLKVTAPTTVSVVTVTAEGPISKVNITNRSLYVKVTNQNTGAVSEKEIFIATGAVITNAISGAAVDFLSLNIDDYIVASGTLKDGKFYASKIVIM
ncbi:MAG: S-layer homology domain-containing protein [Clostridia bacterium]